MNKAARGFFCALSIFTMACQKQAEPVIVIAPEDFRTVRAEALSEFFPVTPEDFSLECLYKTKDKKTDANEYYLWISGTVGGEKQEALLVLDIKDGTRCVGREMLGRKMLSDLGIISLYLNYAPAVAQRILQKLKQ